MSTIRFALQSFFVFAPAAILAQANDTVIVNNPDQVIISQNSDTLSVRISGKEGNPDFRFSREVSLSNQSVVSTLQTLNRRSPLSWDFKEIENDDRTSLLELSLFKGFSFGFLSTFDRPHEMDGVKFFKSLEASFTMMSFIYYPGHSRNWYSLDFDLTYRQIMMKGEMRFVSNSNDEIAFSTYPEGAKSDYSMLQMLRPEISLNFYRTFKKDLSFGIGLSSLYNAYPNFNFCRSHYTDNAGSEIRQVDDIGEKYAINFAIKAQLIFNGIGIYLKYYPKSGFKSDHGPQFQALGAGLVFKMGR